MHGAAIRLALLFVVFVIRLVQLFCTQDLILVLEHVPLHVWLFQCLVNCDKHMISHSWLTNFHIIS
jgi:hypothetical protein